MPKHIAFLIMNMENGGGTERVTSVIANELVKREYQVSIISCQQGNSCRFQLDDQIRLYSLCGENTNNGVLRKLNTFFRLKELVKEERIDVVVAVDVSLYCYLYPLQRMKRCKCIAWEHFNYHIVPTKLVKFGRKLAAENADCCIVLGQNDLKSYQKNYRCKNVQYIYNPIALNTQVTADIESKRIIAVGRLNHQKGFDLLIKAWEQLEKKYPEWRVDIFGEGELKVELQELIAKYGLQRIQLKGYAPDIESEYLQSSIFALSSRYEGFVLVLMEAQAKGLPCVSFNCYEGPAEIIDDGVNGYLVKSGDCYEFAEKLKYLMDNKKLRVSFAKKAQKDLSRFDTTEIINKWIEVIENL